MKTWEMIKELTENPKKRFKYNTGSESGIVANVQGEIMVIECSSKPHKPNELVLHRGFMIIDWELVREPVDFITAINSNRPISSSNGNWTRCTPEWILKQGPWLTLGDINSKWYIE